MGQKLLEKINNTNNVYRYDSLNENEATIYSENDGYKGAGNVEELVAGVSALFVGGELSEHDKVAVMRALQGAYWMAKERNKEKYTPKKYRKDKEVIMSYTREQIRLHLDEIASDMSLFYKRGCINYRGKTSDTKEYYTEVIAKWLLEHLDLLEQIKPIMRQSSYWMEGHDGIPDNPNSNREEELIAMSMKRQGSLPLVGQVLDYQTPLKSVQKDKAGKIDLLTYDGKTLRILELKEPDSKETMLRCVLEGYTYLRTVDKYKLISDFSRDSGVNIPEDTALEACPFVFRDGFQWKEMQQNRPYLKRLMATLNSKPYYIVDENGVYVVKEE